MAKMLLMLVLLTCNLAVAQPLSPADYRHYEGYFVPMQTGDDPFLWFEQFELHVSMAKDSLPILTGLATFFSDTTLTPVDTNCTVPIRIVSISKDSLHFQSEDCLGETYEFIGGFLGVPADFEVREKDPVLEGVVIHRKGQTLVKEWPTKFRWSFGD